MTIYRSHMKSHTYLSTPFYAILYLPHLLFPYTWFNVDTPFLLFWTLMSTISDSINSIFFIQTPKIPGPTHWKESTILSGQDYFKLESLQAILLTQRLIKVNRSSNQETQTLAPLISLVNLLSRFMFSSSVKGGSETWILASILDEFMNWRRLDRWREVFLN